MLFEAVVKEIIQRTPNVKSIRFNRPKEFQYLPGQYMYIELNINGQRTQKHFTISSSPTELTHLELTKKLTGHEFANALASLRVGDKVGIEGPEGDFTFVGEYPKILTLTGGIGITPIRSIMRYCTDLRLKSDITLLYSNGSEDDIAFKDELDDMQKSNDKLKIFYTLTQSRGKWDGLMGRINGDMIRRAVPDFMDRVSYISGAQTMVDDLNNIILRDLKVPAGQVKTEYFPGY
jgi:ferredoxin-NADP reductase